MTDSRRRGDLRQHDGPGQHGDPRQQLVDALFDSVAQTRYPSGPQLDLIEQVITDDQRAELAALLIEKIGSDRYPSPSMIRRALRLVS